MDPMLSAPTSGRSSVMCPTRSAIGSPTHPVEKLTMMSGVSATMARAMAR